MVKTHVVKEILGKLHIGHSNGKQLLKKLNAFGYTESDVKRYLWKRRVNKGGEKDIATPSRTLALLDQFGFNFKKFRTKFLSRCEYHS